MTEEQLKVYRKVFEEDAKRKQECNKPNNAHDNQQLKIAHQNDKIAHPDAMGKTPATILLVVSMIGSLIFNQWYLIWAILLIWYFSTNRI